jgi:iron complex outermembrane receptor protein
VAYWQRWLNKNYRNGELHVLNRHPGILAPLNLRQALLPALLAAFALAAPSRAQAATAAAATAAAADGAAPLEEITITARRRSERLSDAPLAATVQTGRELQEQSALLIEDVAREVPNVLAFKSARSVSALEITMRGQTAVPSSIVYDPAVGLYVDGVYVANGQGAMGTLLDIDRVEIVRGAQGTLFGRNNTGGSVALTTNRPDLGGYAEEFSLAGGSKSLFEGRAIFNVPLSGTFGLRFAYQSNRHDGWGSSLATGQDNFMNQHRDQLRVGALWRPSDSFDAYFSFERFNANEVGALLHPLANTFLASIPGVQVPDDFYQTDTGTIQSDVARTDALQLTLRQHFSALLDAKLILAYRSLRDVNDYDADALAVPAVDVALSSTSYQRSAELQLNGTTPGSAVDWVGGLYWFHDHGSSDSNQAPSILATPPFDSVNTLELNSVHNRSLAGFLHGELHVNRAWSIAAGVRDTHDERSVDDNAFWLNLPGAGPQTCSITDAATGAPLGFETATGACPPLHSEISYSYWSWELASHYRINDRLMTYLRSGRAQRSGGWNIPVASNQPSPFRPEQLTDVELGLKGSSDDGKMIWSMALFSGQYTDMQRLLALFAGQTVVTEVINAGKARVDGLEFESQAQLTRSFSLRAALGYTEASYQRFTGPDGSDLSHNDFYMTPRFQWNLAGMYDVALGHGRLRARADYAWHDRVEFNVINDFNHQSPVGLVNARVSYQAGNSGFEVAIFGTNLSDERYAYNGGTILAPLPPLGQAGPLTSWQAAADRRLIGLEVSYRLGPRH